MSGTTPMNNLELAKNTENLFGVKQFSIPSTESVLVCPITPEP